MKFTHCPYCSNPLKAFYLNPKDTYKHYHCENHFKYYYYSSSFWCIEAHTNDFIIIKNGVTHTGDMKVFSKYPIKHIKNIPTLDILNLSLETINLKIKNYILLK